MQGLRKIYGLLTLEQRRGSGQESSPESGPCLSLGRRPCLVLLSFLGREAGGLAAGSKGKRWSEVLGSHPGLLQTSSVSWLYFVKERGR